MSDARVGEGSAWRLPPDEFKNLADDAQLFASEIRVVDDIDLPVEL